VRLIATARTLGLLLGPAAGGVIMLALGPSTTVLLNALIYLPLTLWLVRAPYGPKFRTGPQPKRAAIRGFHDVVATARAISGNRTIVAMTLLAGAASFFVGNAFQPLIPAFAADLGFARSEVYYSLLLGANAAGAVAAGIGLELRGALTARPRTAMMLAIAWCVVIAGFALSTSYALALVLLFCAGFLNLAYVAMTQTLVQLEAPAEIRGRVIGLYSTAAFGLISFSGVTVGFGANLVGIHWSLALSAAALLLIAIGLLVASPQRRFAPS
jgi:MFS family permease